MSTALSHLSGAPAGLLSGAAGGYDLAALLEECFGPAKAVNGDGLDELFEAVEGLLKETRDNEAEDDDSPAPGAAAE